MVDTNPTGQSSGNNTDVENLDYDLQAKEVPKKRAPPRVPIEFNGQDFLALEEEFDSPRHNQARENMWK